MGLIREELYKVEKNWNLHKIRPSNADAPHGRPDTLFFLPEEAGATDFQKDADMNDLEVAENSVRGKRCHPLGCSLALVSLAELILEDNDLHLPQDPDEAKSLYLDLL